MQTSHHVLRHSPPRRGVGLFLTNHLCAPAPTLYYATFFKIYEILRCSLFDDQTQPCITPQVMMYLKVTGVYLACCVASVFVMAAGGPSMDGRRVFTSFVQAAPDLSDLALVHSLFGLEESSGKLKSWAKQTEHTHNALFEQI